MPLATTSGVNTFELTQNQILIRALQGAGVCGAEETPELSAMLYAKDILNAMMKMWEADNMGNWAQTEGTLFLNQGQAVYSIGYPNPSMASSINVVETTLEVAVLAGHDILEVTSAKSDPISFPATMAINDHIGIVQTDGSLFWTTITGIAGEVITTTDNLTVGAAVGTSVYSYTTTMSRPMNITQVRFRNTIGIDRPLSRLSREDYYALPTKSTTSDPLQFYYDPQLNSGTLFIWPVANDSNTRLKFTYVRTIDDIINAADNCDFPQEFTLPLIENLSALIAPTYGKEQKVQTLGPIADAMKGIAKGFDVAEGSVYFSPDNSSDD